MSYYSACGCTALMTIYLISVEPTILYIFVWTIWALLQVLIVYFIWQDVIIFGGFWLVLRCHAVYVVDQVIFELQNLTLNAIRRKKKVSNSEVNRFLEIWDQRYRKVIKVLYNFDFFSRFFLFVLTGVSSVSCASFLYAVLEINDLVFQITIFPLLIAYIVNAVLLLYAATTIYSQGRRMYVTLNSSLLGLNSRLTIHRRFSFKNTIYQTGNRLYPSISLTTLGGVPYNVLEFAEFVSSFATLMVMIFDFARSFN
jgi:hypothetical protein